MIVTIHQPEYFPWIGFFNRIASSDVFIILDDVSYQKNGFINRNKIKTRKGWQWITVPVQGRSPHKLIKEVLIDNQKDWKREHWSALLQNYESAPYFKDYAGFFEAVFERDWKFIVELDIYLIRQIVELLGLKTKIERSSLLDVPGQRTARLVNLCKKLGGTTYLSGPGGKAYLEIDKFEKENIKVVFHEFEHPVYSQQFMEQGFLSYMSIIDLLFNEGPKSIPIVKGKV